MTTKQHTNTDDDLARLRAEFVAMHGVLSAQVEELRKDLADERAHCVKCSSAAAQRAAVAVFTAAHAREQEQRAADLKRQLAWVRENPQLLIRPRSGSVRADLPGRGRPMFTVDASAKTGPRWVAYSIPAWEALLAESPVLADLYARGELISEPLPEAEALKLAADALRRAR